MVATMKTLRSILACSSATVVEFHRYLEAELERRTCERESYERELECALREGRACLIPLEPSVQALLRELELFDRALVISSELDMFSFEPSLDEFKEYGARDGFGHGFPCALIHTRVNTPKRSDTFQFAFAEHFGSPRDAKYR